MDTKMGSRSYDALGSMGLAVWPRWALDITNALGVFTKDSVAPLLVFLFGKCF